MAAPLAAAAGVAGKAAGAGGAGAAGAGGGAGGAVMKGGANLKNLQQARAVKNVSEDGGEGAAKIVFGFLLLLIAPILVALVFVTAIFGPTQTDCGAGPAGDVTAISADGVPAGARPFIEMYRDAAGAYGVNPFLLMAVHEDETTYSTSKAPGVATGVNFAGCCAGPMQFFINGASTPSGGGSGATWGGFRLAYKKARLARLASYPGRFAAPGAATPNVYDSYDSIYAAAMYFKSLKAGPQLDQKTFNALVSYKGNPPASISYARHDFERAKELQAAASSAGNSSVQADTKKEKKGAGTAMITLALPLAAVGAGGGESSGGGGVRLGWPTDVKTITSPFGTRRHPVTGAVRMHEGLDIGAPGGAPIRAAAAGRVIMRAVLGGYGNYLCINHAPRLATCYAHMSRFGSYQANAPVPAGGVIGYVGHTGIGTGDHLHFEVRTSGSASDPAVDPVPYLRGAGSVPAAGGDDALATSLGGGDCGPLGEATENAATPGSGELQWPADGGQIIGRPNVPGSPHDPAAYPNNWQSDNALDIGLTFGSKLFAADDGTVTRTGGENNPGSRFGGLRFTLITENNQLFYTHLSRLSVREGQRVKRGQLVGYSGTANNVAHLHIGVLKGNPLELFGRRENTSRSSS